MHNCSNCGTPLDLITNITLNATHYCPSCLLMLIQANEIKLYNINVLKDNNYVYTLPRVLLCKVLTFSMSKIQYRLFKQKYPFSGYISSVYYSETDQITNVIPLSIR